MKEAIHICEVGLRDGLQNENARLSIEEKLALYNGLVDAGVKTIEIGSFVHPQAVPAMADTDRLGAVIRAAYPGRARVLGLVMNDRGFDRAVAAGVDGVCIVTVVSETLCLKNNRCTADEATQMAVRLLERARLLGLYTRVDVATAWVCPYEGQISIDQVKRQADQIWEYRPDELAFCDSIGHAHPAQVATLFQELGDRYERDHLVAHFHDTKAMGLANATAALLQGIRRFDASLGGLGGCPFAPGAKGNLATEDLVHLCESMGFATGIQVKDLWPLVARLEAQIGRTLGGQSRSWYSSLALQEAERGASCVH